MIYFIFMQVWKVTNGSQAEMFLIKNDAYKLTKNYSTYHLCPFSFGYLTRVQKKKQKTKRGHCDGQGRGELHSETYDSKNETLLIVLKIKKYYENGALNIISFYGLPKTSNISFYGIPHCRTSEKLTIMCKNGFLWDFFCNIIMNNSYSKKQLLQ